MKKMMIIAVVLALLCAGCTPYSEVVPETPQDVVEIGMYVITGGTNPESMVIGADGTPSPLRAPTGLAAKISEQLSYEVVSITETGDTATAVLNITAPDAVSLMYQALDGMETYDEAAFVEAFDKLLANAPATKTFTVDVQMQKTDGKWCMVMNDALSNALTGGLMAEYNTVRQAILDKLMEGGAG